MARGTSLVEVMVASTILIVVLSSATMAIAFGVRHVGHTRRVAEAERIAATQVEQLLILGARGDVSDRGLIRYGSDGRADDEGPYTATWALEREHPVPGGARLRVEVAWDEGIERKVGINTYLVPETSPPGRP